MCKLHYNVIIEKRNRHQEYLELTIPDFITVRTQTAEQGIWL